MEWGTLDIEQKDKREIAIPAVGDFKVLGVRAVQEAEEYALVQFSDPIAINQDLRGLINSKRTGRCQLIALMAVRLKFMLVISWMAIIE